MYLVCYFRLEDRETSENRFVKRVILSLAGPVEHCELAFVSGGICNALLMSTLYNHGYANVYRNRIYSGHPDPETGVDKYSIKWYKFTKLTYDQQCRCEAVANTIGRERTHKISIVKMMLSSMSSVFAPFFEFAYRLMFGPLKNNRVRHRDKLSYCAAVAVEVINPVLKTPFTRDCSATELLVQLLRAGELEAVEDPCKQQDEEEGRLTRALRIPQILIN